MGRYTTEDAASVLTAHDEPHEDLDAWPSVSPSGNTASIKLTPMIEDRVGSHPDDKAAEHFTAVIVEGDQPPLVAAPGQAMRFSVADFSISRDDEIGAFALRFVDEARRVVIVGLDADMGAVLLADEFTGEGDQPPIGLDPAVFEKRVNERFGDTLARMLASDRDGWPAQVAALRAQILHIDVDVPVDDAPPPIVLPRPAEPWAGSDDDGPDLNATADGIDFELPDGVRLRMTNDTALRFAARMAALAGQEATG